MNIGVGDDQRSERNPRLHQRRGIGRGQNRGDIGAAPAQCAQEVDATVRLDDQPSKDIAQSCVGNRDFWWIEIGHDARKPQRIPSQQPLACGAFRKRKTVQPRITLEADLGQRIFGAAQLSGPLQTDLATQYKHVQVRFQVWGERLQI